MKIVISTFPANSEINAFTAGLVEKRLAACVNIVNGISSVYFWQDKLCSESENLLIIKTTEQALPALEEEFRSSHPYEVFEFVVLDPQQVNQKYEDWVRQFIAGRE